MTHLCTIFRYTYTVILSLNIQNIAADPYFLSMPKNCHIISMTNQNRLLINNCYQITYSLKINRQIYSATFPLPLQYQARSSQKIHGTLSEYPKFFLLCPFLPQKLLSRQTNQRTFVCLLRDVYGVHMVSARKHNDLPRHCSRNFNEKHLQIPLPKACFSSENHAVFMSRKCTSKMQMAAVCALGY